MSELDKKVTNAFIQHFGKSPSALLQAPGRVNIIGEHTDYNDGFVLPCAINFKTIAAASARNDDKVHVVSVDYHNEHDEFVVSNDISKSHLQWANYIRGVVKHLRLRGYVFSGANIAISGDVPQGAGLSSSAALEVVICQVFKTLYQLNISSQEIALTAQEAENQFVGCQSGIMDQLISAQASNNCALLIDCRNLETKPFGLPKTYSIVIINSNKQRVLVNSEYNLRREQCNLAALFFGAQSLRDVGMENFLENQHLLDPLIAKRAKHVITENQRTLLAAQALQQEDIFTLQRVMAESHISMRDDFEITVKEIDLLVDIVKDVIGELGGVRMTGGGFGGCVVSLIPSNLVNKVSKMVTEHYPTQTGLEASIYVCSASSGSGVILPVE